MKHTFALAVLSLSLASCGGNGAAPSAAQLSAETVVATPVETAAAHSVQVSAIDAPADGASLYGPVTLSVSAANLGRVELQNESGQKTLGRFAQDTSGSKWTLSFDPDTVAQNSMFMVRIVAWPTNASQDGVEVARSHWLNTETCPSAEEKA